MGGIADGRLGRQAPYRTDANAIEESRRTSGPSSNSDGSVFQQRCFRRDCRSSTDFLAARKQEPRQGVEIR